MTIVYKTEKELSEEYGRFFSACMQLCRLRTYCDGMTDNEIGESFDLRMRDPEIRKCFNKKSFIKFCREPD